MCPFCEQHIRGVYSLMKHKMHHSFLKMGKNNSSILHGFGFDGSVVVDQQATNVEMTIAGRQKQRSVLPKNSSKNESDNSQTKRRKWVYSPAISGVNGGLSVNQKAANV